MKIFITGGSGFLGINLIRELLKEDLEVTSYDIQPFEYVDIKHKIKNIIGDICDKNKLKINMVDCDLVIHCAAALPLYTKDQIYNSNYIGTRTVFEAAHEVGINRIIHISSTAVYGIPDHHPLYEDDLLEGVGDYGVTKLMAEKVAESYRHKKMAVTILRPKSFIGPERLGVFAILFDWIKDGKNIPIVGFGKNKYQLLDVEDLCRAIILCANLPQTIVNDTFNIGAKKFTTMREDFGEVLSYAGYGKKVIGTPAKPIILLLRLLEKLNMSPLYKWVYETAPKDSYVDVSKAESVLGFVPKYSTKESLIRTYQWYENNLESFENKEGVSHRVPWKQGVLKFIKWFF